MTQDRLAGAGASLLESLGPQLYDSRLTEDELEGKVRATLQEVLAHEETPLTVTDRHARPRRRLTIVTTPARASISESSVTASRI